MSNDRDDKLNKDTEAAEFTLEEILAEFGSGPKPSGPDLPWTGKRVWSGMDQPLDHAISI